MQQSPRSAESALYRALYPDEHAWQLSELLLAEIADALNVANWQRSAGKRKDYPKPIPRPGVSEKASQTYGSNAVPIADMAAFLGWPTS